MSLYDFLLPELSDFRDKDGKLSFEEAYSLITNEISIRETAKILGKVKRIPITNTSKDFLELIHIFRDLEAAIRFSIWPKGIKAPHHFSKCLQKEELISTIGEKNVHVLTAILGDPKGLNIRNTAAHGLTIDTGFSRPIIDGIKSKIIPLLPEPFFPTIDFSNDVRLLYFFKDYLSLSDEIKGFEYAKSTIFPFINGEREKLLIDAYDYFYQKKYVDSLLLLFPIFEQSLRIFAVERLHLPEQRKSADPNEQFLSIPECFDSLPLDLSRMCNDIMFHPDGPRIRDRLMHEGIKDIPRELAILVFDLFERICSFSVSQTFGKWYFAYHPSRILEYNMYLCSGIRGFDTFPYYSSKTCARFIDGVKKAIEGKGAVFKDSKATEYCSTLFPNLVATITLYLIKLDVNDKMFTHYMCIVGAPTKYANLHCSERMWECLKTEISFMRKLIPLFKQKPTIDDIYEYSSEEYLQESLRQF